MDYVSASNDLLLDIIKWFSMPKSAFSFKINKYHYKTIDKADTQQS